MIEFQLGNIHTKVNKKLALYEELRVIHSCLAVKVPGYYHSRQFKRGQWDGSKKFFNLLTGTFYTGLLGLVIEELKAKNIEYRVVDSRTLVPSRENELHLSGIELREYQSRMIREAIAKGRGIISAPPNAGKTEIAAGIIKVLGLPANFLTHRMTLLHQTRERLSKRLGIEVGILGGGEEDIKEVNVISIATLKRRLEDDEEIENWLKDAPVVISDECHRISSKSWEKCLLASDAYWRFGLSATPLLRDDVSNMLVRGLTGDEISSISSQELMSLGISALPTLYLFTINEPKISSHYTFDLAYDKGVLHCDERNRKIVLTAKKFIGEGKSVFILVWRIEHGEILFNQLKEQGIESEFISGQTSSTDVKSVLKRFDAKKLKCLISSTISDEGLDVPSMDVLIMGVGFKAPHKTIQRVGRGLRKKREGDNVVKIVDFVDFHNKRYLLKHSKDRLKEYVGLDMAIYEVMDEDWQVLEGR